MQRSSVIFTFFSTPLCSMKLPFIIMKKTKLLIMYSRKNRPICPCWAGCSKRGIHFIQLPGHQREVRSSRVTKEPGTDSSNPRSCSERASICYIWVIHSLVLCLLIGPMGWLASVTAQEPASQCLKLPVLMEVGRNDGNHSWLKGKPGAGW